MAINGSETDFRRVPYDVEVHRDVRIPTSNTGVTLSGDLYLPTGAGPVPALVTVVPYRKDLGSVYEASLRWFAERGYAGLLANHTGIGSSDGAPHLPWGPGEADDAVAVVEWAAGQQWCDGAVGMWGHSHGGFTSLRAASRHLPQLKAIVALMNAADIEHDIMHPDGARGDFVRLASWGAEMLMQQLLPPMVNHTSAKEQRRWRRRLRETEPFVVDLARLGPGHSGWRDRVIDTTAINTPTLCVGGWQDSYPEAVIRVYEQIAGPKKLLVGPWGHTLPEGSLIQPIAFRTIALRWWDYYLRDVENGVMDEPPITVYVQGSEPGWRSYASWPPPSKELLLSTGSDTKLTEPSADATSPRAAIAEHLPDPTTGALSGLRGVGLGGFGLPLDQHDDDMRAVTATSTHLAEDILICGRPEVTVRLAEAGRDDIATTAAVERLVVRLTEVDSEGRSTFITSGVLCSDEPTDMYRVVLWPTAYRIRAGNRLRVVLSDSDFPRLMPLPAPCSFRVAHIELATPTLPEDAGTPVDMPNIPPPALQRPPHWTITRDHGYHGIEVAIERSTPATSTAEGHQIETYMRTCARVRRDAPDAALITGERKIVARMRTGETMRVTVIVRCSQTAFWARCELAIDDITTYTRTWDVPSTASQRVRG